jgi:hypothetical protein
MREGGSHCRAEMHIYWRSGITKQQGNRTMMKNLVLAASITMLVAISGQAFARTATPNERYGTEAATVPSDRQPVNGFNAFEDPAMPTHMDEPNAYRYHGGPKSND